MLVLGLDPSLTNYGYALFDNAAQGAARCPFRGRLRTSAKTLEIERYLTLREELRAVCQKVRQDHGDFRVACESPIFGDSYSEGMYALFIYTQEVLYTEKVDTLFVGVSQNKAYIREYLQRPKGWTMHKSDMVEAAMVDTSTKKAWNHNEADAYLIARLGARFWAHRDGTLLPEGMSTYERHMIAGSKKDKAGRVTNTGAAYREGSKFHLWGSPSSTKSS